MILQWLLRLLVPGWDDLIVNPATGRPSGKNLFAAVSFIVGIGLAIEAVQADVATGRPVDTTTILLLLGNGGLLAGLKVYQGQLNRKTADDAGQPLAVPPPATEAPEMMPQIPNPNAPIE